MKLKTLLTEIKIDRGLTKKQIFDFLKDGHIYLFAQLANAESVEELLENWGFNTLEEFLDDEFGYYEESIPAVAKYIKAYYKAFKPGDIIVEIFEDGVEIHPTKQYNTILCIYGGGTTYLICHNL